jgi:N utilization substance protein B
MRTLYSQQFGKENTERPFYSYLNVTKEDKEMSRELIEGVNTNLEAINNDIDEHLKKWKSDRLPKVDIAILQMAIYELKYQKKNPPGAIINEAVELAKEFSLSDSAGYINAILASVLKSV